jgi:hypothetical protein
MAAASHAEAIDPAGVGPGVPAFTTPWTPLGSGESGNAPTPPAPLAAPRLSASTTAHIDGIDDQNLQSSSDPYFSAFFYKSWVGGSPSHITFSRYVVQWNVMSGRYPAYLAKYEVWYASTKALGLTPELAVTSYDGVLPKTSSEYRREIGRLLALKAIPYFEPWNEPNNRPFLPESAAAHFTNSASALCRTTGCTVIAGDFLDSPNMVGYETKYEKNLVPPNPQNWGIHPYYAVKAENEATVAGFRANLPNSDDAISFTEIGAYYCVHGQQPGELQQAVDASWLVNRLMPGIRPVHAIYYDYLDSNSPSCAGSEADTSLYRPAPDPNAPAYPRPAASYVFDGRGLPSAYTGPSAGTAAADATITGSVNPGGFFDARYHFEFGLTSAYGYYSPEGDAGSGSGAVAARTSMAALLPGTTYHYRLVAWNKEGTSEEGPSVGADQTFHTGDF